MKKFDPIIRPSNQKTHPEDAAEQELELGQIPLLQRRLQLLDRPPQQDGLGHIPLLFLPGERPLLLIYLEAEPPVLGVRLGRLQPRSERGGAVVLYYVLVNTY
jgi:hypothetical protein